MKKGGQQTYHILSLDSALTQFDSILIEPTNIDYPVGPARVFYDVVKLDDFSIVMLPLDSGFTYVQDLVKVLSHCKEIERGIGNINQQFTQMMAALGPLLGGAPEFSEVIKNSQDLQLLDEEVRAGDGFYDITPSEIAITIRRCERESARSNAVASILNPRPPQAGYRQEPPE